MYKYKHKNRDFSFDYVQVEFQVTDFSHEIQYLKDAKNLQHLALTNLTYQRPVLSKIKASSKVNYGLWLLLFSVPFYDINICNVTFALLQRFPHINITRQLQSSITVCMLQ